MLGSGVLEFGEFCQLAARFLVEEDEEALRGGHSINHSFIHHFTYSNSLLHSFICWLAYSFIYYFIKNSFLLCNNINGIQLILFLLCNNINGIQLILFIFEPTLYNGMSLTCRKIRTEGNLNPPGIQFRLILIFFRVNDTVFICLFIYLLLPVFIS